MGHCSVEKVTLRFGKSPASDAGVWENAYAGIPGGTLLEGAARLPFPDPALGAAGAVNRLSETGVILRIPKKAHSLGPVRAISIAPDSPIECVDLYINGSGGSSVHRIGPRSPWIGQLSEDDTIRVVPIREIPYLGWRQDNDTADVRLNSAFWDCTITPDPALVSAGEISGIVDVPSVLIPVRLNLYRGDVPALPSGGRASYHASLLWAAGPAALITSARFFVITDGRRRVRVVCGQEDGGGASVSLYGVEASKSTPFATPFDDDIDPDRRLDVYNLTELVAATAIGASIAVPTILDYDGNPYFAVLVGITGAVADETGYVQVHCWDE
jgi:hypothetical protein